MTVSGRQGGVLDRPSSSGLADVIDLILDKGLVIDVYVRVSLVGIELLTIDARVVVASVDTYLRFAEAANRLDLARSGDAKGLPELVGEVQRGGARHKTKGMLEGVKGSVSDALGLGDDDRRDEEEEDYEERPRRRPRQQSRAAHEERER
ncbi:hypothetical protein GCM10027168_32290 [Streptomyces capparidis]